MAELTENKGVAHRVKVSVGYTRNMQNFESLRVDVGLEVDGFGNPDATFTKTYDWVEKKLIEKVEAVEKELKATKE
jgi:hypothetical protein